MHRHNKLTGRLRLVVDNTRAQPKRRHRRTRKAYDGAVSTQDRARPTNRAIGLANKNDHALACDERQRGTLLDIGTRVAAPLSIHAVDGRLDSDERRDLTRPEIRESTDRRNRDLSSTGYLAERDGRHSNTGAEIVGNQSDRMHAQDINERFIARSSGQLTLRAKTRSKCDPADMVRRQRDAILDLYGIFKSWAKLEKRTGVYQSTWRSWRDEKFAPSGTNGKKVADALGCEVDHLLGRKMWPDGFLDHLREEVAARNQTSNSTASSSDTALRTAREMLRLAEAEHDAAKKRAEADISAAEHRVRIARDLVATLSDVQTPKQPTSSKKAS